MSDRPGAASSGSRTLGSGSGTGVAVVVPVLRDADALERLVAAFDGFRSRPQEVVVVTGEPDAALERWCRDRGHRYLEAPANRGAQLDLGARAAAAPVLWFLHADTVVPRDGIDALRAALDAGAESGCFRFAFQGRQTPTKAVLAFFVALRVRLGGIPYGDQALFVTRRAYEDCGGFPHQPLFEEVRLVKRLRTRGTFVALDAQVAVATRRWERDGWWRRTLHNRRLAICYMLGAPAERLAAAYGASKKAAGDGRRGKGR